MIVSIPRFSSVHLTLGADYDPESPKPDDIQQYRIVGDDSGDVFINNTLVATMPETQAISRRLSMGTTPQLQDQVLASNMAVAGVVQPAQPDVTRQKLFDWLRKASGMGLRSPVRSFCISQVQVTNLTSDPKVVQYTRES